MDKYHYKLIWIRLSISFLGAFYININGHIDLVPKALVSPMFYVAFTVSFAICYLLLYLIDFANNFLDEKYPWQQNRSVRMVMQIVLGIICPALAHLMLICLFFMVSGRINMLEDFFKHDYLTVVIFITTLNILPPGKWLNNNKKGNNNAPAGRMVIKYNGASLSLNVSIDILYIYKENRKVKIVTVSGKTYTDTITISHIIGKYASSGLCQTNPGVIINLHMLKGYVTGARSKTLQLLFKTEYHTLISTAKEEHLRVTREYLNSFKTQLKKTLAG